MGLAWLSCFLLFQACDWRFYCGGVASPSRASRTSPLPTLWGVSRYSPVVCLWALFCLFSYDLSLRFFTWLMISNLAFHNLRPSGADCLHLRVERGFSGAMATPPAFFGIPKDNLATPQDWGLAAYTVIDGFRWFRLLSLIRLGTRPTIVPKMLNALLGLWRIDARRPNGEVEPFDRVKWLN